MYFRISFIDFLRSFFILFLFPDFSFCQAPESTVLKGNHLPNPFWAQVIAVQDGDTIELKYIFTGKQAGHRKDMSIRVRLLNIDCPEKGKPFYGKAKQFTAESCFGQVVKIRHNGSFDRYGRLLAEIYLGNGKNLNKELVKGGLAIHFKKYSADTDYAELELKAQHRKVGIWHD